MQRLQPQNTALSNNRTPSLRDYHRALSALPLQHLSDGEVERITEQLLQPRATQELDWLVQRLRINLTASR